MALKNEQIEHMPGQRHPKAGKRKWMKNQRNRKIRYSKEPKVKFNGWEY